MNASAFPGQTTQPIPVNPGPVNDDDFSLLQKIAQNTYNAAASGGGSGFIVVNGIPYAYNYQAFTYYGATNNVQTITYKSGGSGGTTVATQTFTYVGGGASDDDDIATISIA